MAMTSGTSTAEDRHLWKMGGLLAIVGGFIFMIANMLHPRSPDLEVYEEQIRTVAASDIWIVDHLAFLLGALLIILGLYALGRSISDGPAATWARFGSLTAVISGGVISVLIGLDGIASKFVHDGFVAASAAEEATALRISEMLEEVDVAIFSVFILVFFGITFLFYGLAVALGSEYPTWLGWTAVVLAAAALIIGTVQAIDGLSTITTSVLFVGVASLLNLWIIVIGWYMWRRASQTE